MNEFQVSDVSIANAPIVLQSQEMYGNLCFNMNGIQITIDMKNGNVTHTGTLNEAAEAFWAAVRLLHPCHKPAVEHLEYRGDKFTLHIKDASRAYLNPGIRVRVSENELNNFMGISCLLAPDLNIDETAELIIKNHKE